MSQVIQYWLENVVPERGKDGTEKIVGILLSDYLNSTFPNMFTLK
jgi:hypothetical protein